MVMGKDFTNVDVAGLRKGLSSAFESLLKNVGESSLRIAYNFCGDLDQAKDILQETLLKVLNNINTFRDGQPFTPWYFRILTNTCKDWKRTYFWRFRNPLSQKVAHTLQVLPPPIDEELEILQFIRRMPRKMRIIFILHYQEEMPVVQIAEILQISENTVRVQLMRGRQFLRKILEKEMKDVEI